MKVIISEQGLIQSPEAQKEKVRLVHLFPPLHFVCYSPTRGVYVPGSRVVLGPNPDELIEVMRPQDGGVSG